MSDITKIDKNFKIATKINKPNIKFFDAKCDLFDIYGLYKPFEIDKYCRMDPEVAKAVSGGVESLNKCTAGARIRFKTNSNYVAINRKLDFFKDGGGKIPHMTATGSSGYDLYLVENGKQIYYKSFIPPYDFGEEFEQVIEFEDNSEKDIVIHLPLLNGCSELYIGVDESAYIEHGSKYKYENPIVFYGSSITNGGCASRPGNAYTNMVSRDLNVDHLNLGFAGNAKGEIEMAKYIACLNMCIFVYDYDHNAPNAEHLEKTHENMFKLFRASHPKTPVIIMSKTDIPITKSVYADIDKRRSIIKATYDNAIAAGDKNVYFIDGQEIFKLAGNTDCTVDGCHPNDIGFWCMAQTVIKVIEENKLL